MSRQFSLATVCRMVPNDLLAQFFRRLKNPCFGMDWRHRPRRHVESVLQCLEYFSPAQRAAAELILRQVFELACASGIAALRDAARQFAVLDRLPSGYAPYALAMWTWLNHPQVFEHAVLFHEVDQLAWWRKRDDLPQTTPRSDEETLGQLAQDVSRLLTREQGRGRQCTVEHVCREDGTDYYFCFPDDYPQVVTLHNAEGKLTTKRLRQTFEIIFAYRQAEGTLELSARVPARLKRELEESFAWLILEENLGPRLPRQVYELNELKRRQYRLDTDPADQVHVHLRRIRLDLPDRCRRITLEATKGGADEVGQMVEECLNEERVSLDEVDVSLATFRFHFARTTGRERGTMTFDVATPDTCNLRTHRPERVEIARKHLRLWRISRD